MKNLSGRNDSWVNHVGIYLILVSIFCILPLKSWAEPTIYIDTGIIFNHNGNLSKENGPSLQIIEDVEAFLKSQPKTADSNENRVEIYLDTKLTFKGSEINDTTTLGRGLNYDSFVSPFKRFGIWDDLKYENKLTLKIYNETLVISSKDVDLRILTLAQYRHLILFLLKNNSLWSQPNQLLVEISKSISQLSSVIESVEDTYALEAVRKLTQHLEGLSKMPKKGTWELKGSFAKRMAKWSAKSLVGLFRIHEGLEWIEEHYKIDLSASKNQRDLHPVDTQTEELLKWSDGAYWSTDLAQLERMVARQNGQVLMKIDLREDVPFRADFGFGVGMATIQITLNLPNNKTITKEIAFKFKTGSQGRKDFKDSNWLDALSENIASLSRTLIQVAQLEPLRPLSTSAIDSISVCSDSLLELGGRTRLTE